MSTRIARRPALLGLGLSLIGVGTASAACETPGSGLGVARIVNIDASSGPLYGDITKFKRQADFLKPKEVVLTFDDGPLPWITKSILDTLDRFCTKATFFSVGRMAIAYPDMTKAVLERGHTLGTHTWSHPMNLKRQGHAEAVREIERGFAAVAAAAGQPIAPFFRFPGLGDSGPLLTHLQGRGVATFTVDVVSNDSYIPSAERLTRETLAKVEARQGGILLFHDIKAVTARALPDILGELKARGYRVVAITSKHGFEPDAKLAAEFGQQLARAEAKAGGRKPLVPFYGAVGPERIARETGASVVALAPTSVTYGELPAPAIARRAARPRSSEDAGSFWTTTVRRPRLRKIESE
jgi:peptidoglycan/xylan/chitin deacetylase (PgdA/CDA1 family)